MPFVRLFAPVALFLLAACAGNDGLDQPPPDLGDFRLGHNIVVGETARMVPPSRSATAEEWEAALEQEIGKRFGRYEGETFYNLGISVDAYALAVPGVPVVVSPKSVLVMSVTVWRDSTQTKLNEEVKQLTVLESASGDTVVGSGLTKTKEEQMRDLSFNAARAIERWLVENRAWFDENAAPQANAN